MTLNDNVTLKSESLKVIAISATQSFGTVSYYIIFIFIHHNGSTVQYKKYLN